MGRKKGKNRQNQKNQFLASPSSDSPQFQDLGSPNLAELKDGNLGDEIEIPSNSQPKELTYNPYKTVYLSGEDVAEEEKSRGSRGSNSSYHDLIDGGAYNQYRISSRHSLNRSSKLDFDSAGDRVMAGSRSISHRSLFNDDRSFGRSGGNPSKTSLAGSKISLEWEDMENGGDDDGMVRITRRDRSDGVAPMISNEYTTRKPFQRSRTVSSGGSVRIPSSSNVLKPLSTTTSQHAIDSLNKDVRTLHAGSEYLQNRLSKLSIHSNNDEFVLIGGHPPVSSSMESLNREVPIPRPRSRMSSYSGSQKEEELLGKSISQQSLNGQEHNRHVSRSSSRYTVGTSSNTDDRLILAARYSQSPEAEGLLTSHHHPNRSRSRSTVSRSSDRVGFVEIPTLYSHPDERFDDQDGEPGEPFRPTLEHKCTPTAPPKQRQSLRDEVDGGIRTSSSSSTVSRPDQPPKALLVTSALTPVISKRGGAPTSTSHSEESLVMKTPQTVQRAGDQKSLRQKQQEIRKTVETAVQTGNSIRLRQTHVFSDVLSECANLPYHEEDTESLPLPPGYEYQPLPPRRAPPPSSPEIVEIPKNSIRDRLRHLSEIYSMDPDEEEYHQKKQKPSSYVEIPKASQKSSSGYVEIPKTSQKPSSAYVEIPKNKKSSEEIVIPIRVVPSPQKSIYSSTIDIPSINGDTIRKHIPRGRIRDLASAFDKMTGGSPARPLEFKSQVHIPRDTDSGWKKTIIGGGDGDSNPPDTRVGSPISAFNGSSSSAFRSSTQTIRSSEDRRRSTSSSLHHQPQHVFTRYTFLTSSIVKKTSEKVLPSSVAMNTNYGRDAGARGDGFVDAFEKIPPLHTSTNQLNQDQEILIPSKSPTKDTTFSEYSRKVVEVPISGAPSTHQKLQRQRGRFAAAPRAKTQEIPTGTFEFESRYESRAVSGDLNESNVFGMQKPLYSASREPFGRDTAEDLRGKQDAWPTRQQWTSEFQMSASRNSVSSPIYPPRHLPHPDQIPSRDESDDVPKITRKLSAPPAPPLSSSTLPRHPYSPPATEDAGSRITHHTSQTLQSDDLFAATEDSSIRGKIDRMFDFVESDDSRKTQTTTTRRESHASTETIGTNGIINNQQQKSNNNTTRQNWSGNESSRLIAGHNKAPDTPQSLKQPPQPKLKSPDRRNTVTVPQMEYFDNDLEYSLSQYREMQREQLRRRLPSADEPQFFRSPTLTAPHAGQSLHVYRTKDLMGTPTAGEKFRFPSSSSDLRSVPVALATSTPVESPSGRQSSTFSINKNNNNYSSNHLENNNNTSNNPTNNPHETFVSSISRVSAVEKHADVMKKINRLSYMIENTQKQMSMNEAALQDAVKKGRRHQEIAAHRSILISRETLRLQRNELRRLHAFSAVRRPPPPVAKELRGHVIFKNLIVHLNKQFVSRATVKDDNTYSFVAIFKYGHQVEATELVPFRVFPGEETCDKLFFIKQIQFSDVPVDFMVQIEIYAMVQRIPSAKPPELSLGSSLANKCKSLMGPPQKKPIPVETAFKFRGRLILDRDAHGERLLYLDEATYPLEGTVMITTQCSQLPESFEIDFRGFLTMFHTISNMASWERYYAILRRGTVLFWKYPDDEQMGREPKMQIDLTKCTNNSIEKCGFDLCPRANSFVIEMLVDADDGTIGSVVEKKRVLLSADTSELLSQWLYTLNQTLDVIRGPI